MFNIYNTYKKEHPRLTNNIILSVVSLIGCLVAVALASATQSLLEALAVGTGYVGLGLLALTLLIGPLNMLKVRKNPVNMNFRRDAGIWAGIVSLAHVFLVFAMEINWGGTLLGYFLYKSGAVKLNLFGISNYLGLFATLILIFLLVLSNNRFLKALKGKKWKNLQRFNYLLFALVLGHTFTQQVNNVRGLWLVAGALLVTGAVMIGQAIGFRIYRRREQERKVATVAKPAPARVAASTVPAVRANTPAQPAPVVSGFGKLKIASAVGLLAILGVGAGLEGVSLLNNPITAQTGSLTSDEAPSGDTGSAATTPAATATTAPTATATVTPAATTSAATTAASTTAAATTAAATTAAATTAASTTASTTAAATTAASTTAASTTAAAATTAAATTAAATTTAATSTSTTTVSAPSSRGGSAHTGGS